MVQSIGTGVTVMRDWWYSYAGLMVQLCGTDGTSFRDWWYSYARLMVQLCGTDGTAMRGWWYSYAGLMVYSYAGLVVQLCGTNGAVLRDWWYSYAGLMALSLVSTTDTLGQTGCQNPAGAGARTVQQTATSLGGIKRTSPIGLYPALTVLLVLIVADLSRPYYQNLRLGLLWCGHMRSIKLQIFNGPYGFMTTQTAESLDGVLEYRTILSRITAVLK